MVNTATNLQADIEAIGKIPVVPTILEMICRTTGMGFAAVARVTDQRWIACSVHDKISFGLVPGGELKLETTICHEIRQSGQAVVIDHVTEDSLFRDHHTPAMYGFQSYISVPIFLKDGTFFGTLCAIDPEPANLNNQHTLNMFNMYSDLISFHLQALQQVNSIEQELEEERQTAELREQFISILGHDLRNPLGAVSNSIQLMMRSALDERQTRLARIIKDSSYRMNGLIENVLDFARGRLGDGIKIDVRPDEPVEEILHQIIAELQPLWHEHKIELTTELREPVSCDGKRIAQLFSNLLGNALSHGTAGTPVQVIAKSGEGKFTLSVINESEAIPESTIDKLFQPFSRGETKPGTQGLGLGLYISSEIAKAHNGTLEVASDPQRTCFTLRLSCMAKQNSLK